MLLRGRPPEIGIMLAALKRQAGRDMTRVMNIAVMHDGSASLRQGCWVVFVAALSVVFSFALACAMPFAAIATVAAANMPRRGALMLTGVAWLTNQTVGYLALGYPRIWDSFAWGAAIGVAAALATGAVSLLRARIRSGPLVLVAGFTVAFAVYELALFSATAVLPSGDDAFSLPVILQILWPNMLALAALASLHKLALSIGFLARPEAGRDGAYA